MGLNPFDERPARGINACRESLAFNEEDIALDLCWRESLGGNSEFGCLGTDGDYEGSSGFWSIRFESGCVH